MPRVSELEEALAFHLRASRLPAPQRQYKAVEGRRWSWDFAWPTHRLLVEVDGGTWVQGRHTRGYGVTQDAEKQSTAAALGWRTMRLTGDMIQSGRAVELLEIALGLKEHRASAPITKPLVPIAPGSLRGGIR